jgi:glycine cleavage system H protein
MYPEELKYNEEHTWLRLAADGTGRVGITTFAQEQLKEVVFVELPEVGDAVTQMEPFGVIESIKATNDLYAPVSGEVIEINPALEGEPGAVNRDPYGEGWMIVIRLADASQVDALVSSAEYQKGLAGNEGG